MKFNFVSRAFLILSGVLIFSGCMSMGPKFTPQQRRALQMRTFETSYDNVFKAFKTVFQDEGYIIKNQDFAGGMILAQREVSQSGFNLGGIFAGANSNNVVGKGFEVSISLDKLNANLIETRMTLQSLVKTSQGGSSGREVLDVDTYKALYDKVNVEVQRRMARGLE